MDYASIPQPTAGPLSEDLIPKEVSRRGSFFGSFRKSTSFQTNSQVGEEAVGHSSASDAGVASVAAFEGQTHEQDEDSKEEKGEVVPSTTSVDARDDEGNCITCGFPEPSSTSDHRQQGSTKSPEWKTHVMMWLSEAVKSIPAYVERSTIVLVRAERQERRDDIGCVFDPAIPSCEPRFLMHARTYLNIYYHAFPRRYSFLQLSTLIDRGNCAITAAGGAVAGADWN
jgi:hypothetical protein